MSNSPVSADWFKNMALYSISKSLSTSSSMSQLFPTGEIFEAIFQSVLNVNIPEETNQGSASLQSTSSSFLNASSTILSNIKDYTQVVTNNAGLDFSEVSLDQLNSKLKGKLSNMGEQFIEAGRQYNINPNLLASIAIHETGNGASRAAYEKLNIAGMMGKNGLKQYDSIEDSISDMARNLRKNYLDKGFDTIAKIGGKYAPVGAANDPTGLNNHWVKGVNGYFHTFLS